MKNSRTFTTGFTAGLLLLFIFIALGANARGQSRELPAAGLGNLALPTNSTESEKQRIEAVIREYLLKNPAIVREALTALQTQEEEARRKQAAKTLQELNSAIYSDPDSPISGNSKADATVVVFFDYNCGYCKKTLPELDAVLSKDPSLRVIYKEFPILGQSSFLSAQAALAAGKQGKYVEFHRELVSSQTADESAIKSISDRLGLNYTTLRKDMDDPKITEQLYRNIRLANSLSIDGTPAYILGDQIIPGAIDAASLMSLIASQRQKSPAANAASTASSGK